MTDNAGKDGRERDLEARGTRHDHRDPTLWDPLRRTVLDEARKALALADPLIFAEGLDQKLGRGWWHNSITAELTMSVARFRLERTDEAGEDLERIWSVWKEASNTDPSLCDDPLDLLFLLHELLQYAQRSHRETEMRAAGASLRRSYDLWRKEGKLLPLDDAADPLARFTLRCLAASDLQPRRSKTRLPEMTTVI
jgi:hypothetical protein